MENKNITELKIKKETKKKDDKLYAKRKRFNNSFQSHIDKKNMVKSTLYKTSYNSEPDSHTGNKINVELNLSNYAREAALERLLR